MVEYRIIVDSCCDMTRQLKERVEVTSVPVTLRLGEKEYVDDDSLDVCRFRDEVKANTEKAGSAAPAPILYQEAMEAAQNSFVVTVSSRLSSSYANAEMAKNDANEAGTVNTHIFDSKSASAGQTLVALKLHELLVRKIPREQIISQVNAFISQLKTYFVLENYSNLIKSGRMSKKVAAVANALRIKLMMGSDGDGTIALHAKLRTVNQLIEKVLLLIKKSGRKTENENMVISHCNNSDLAELLADSVCKQYKFKEIFIIPTGGLSSLFADDKGIVMAF